MFDYNALEVCVWSSGHGHDFQASGKTRLSTWFDPDIKHLSNGGSWRTPACRQLESFDPCPLAAHWTHQAQFEAGVVIIFWLTATQNRRSTLFSCYILVIRPPSSLALLVLRILSLQFR
jgi:hypothetical protein